MLESINTTRRYLQRDLECVSGLTLAEINFLLELKKFPQPRYREPWGLSWNRKAVEAYRWGLLHSKKHASNIEAVLGYRYDDWA